MCQTTEVANSKLKCDIFSWNQTSNIDIFLISVAILPHINQKHFKTFTHEGERKTSPDPSCSLHLLGAVDIKLLPGPGQQWDIFPKHESAGNYHLYKKQQAIQKYKKKYFSLFSGVQNEVEYRLNAQTNTSTFFCALKL